MSTSHVISMDKDSLRSNYFDRLKRKASEIDNGINRLDETWKTPHLLIGGYGERTAEVNACLEELLESIRSTNNVMEKFRTELEPSLIETDQLLEELQNDYQDLKQQSDDVDIVLAEYSFHYDIDKVVESNNRNDNEDHANDNTLNNITEEMSEMEVEFTPDLKWKYKARSKESNIPK